MNQSDFLHCTAFAGPRRIGSGPLTNVALAIKAVMDTGEPAPILVFDDATSHVIDLDLRGTTDEILRRLEPTSAADGLTDADGDDTSPYRQGSRPRGRGRPKLGVVAREVTLLPRHWDWLATQPGGASAAVRRLIDAARQANVDSDRIRQAKESAYRFMSAMAGNERHFEEATRALFAGDEAKFTEMTKRWPADVRDHARSQAAKAF